MARPLPAPTIYALSTPPGRSAIAVVRLSGMAVSEVLERMCGPRPEPRHASLRRLKDPRSGIVLDEVLVIYFEAPRTETGEDMAEFHLHGGKAIVRAVLDALGSFPDTRPAEPGEFAKRAFENGKIDLAQIEGLADLIDAETESQRQQAVAQASGAQSKRFEGWRAQLLSALGLVEAGIDFSDEGDVTERAIGQAEAVALGLRNDLAAHLDDGHRGEILRDGFRVVLAGPPNAGKSSLLNALARREAAIVSDEPGTTRDVIDARLDLEGLAVIVSDTAGIRDTASGVEQEGIRRTLAVARDADLVVWLSECPLLPATSQGEGRDEGRPQTQVSTIAAPHHDPLPIERRNEEREIYVLTKCDLLPADETIHVKQSSFDLAISAKTGAGLDELTRLIAERARTAAGNASDPAITRARQRDEISRAVHHLDAFLKDKTRALELRAEELRLASVALARLTGKIGAEEVLGQIFSRFCIGK